MTSLPRSLLAGAALAWAAGCSSPEVSSSPAYLASSADQLAFGEVQTGDTEARTVFLINKGESAAKLLGVHGDLLGGVFAVVPAGEQVAPGGDVVVHVSFTPAAVQAYETEVRFLNDSANQPELRVVLKGTGIKRSLCRDVVCDRPPAPACVTSRTSRHWLPGGTCDDATGRCSYAHNDETCDQWGCTESSGRCEGDPCTGVACQTPPNTCFSAEGQCVAGACHYPVLADANCTDNDKCTLDDRCSAGACRGTPRRCDPPLVLRECLNETTLRRHDPVRTCNPATGECDDVFEDVVCANGCTSGACNGDPCAGGCDDHNPCTSDTCQAGAGGGCVHAPNDGAACRTVSGACPTGKCSNSLCQAVPDQSCQTTMDYGPLCGSVTIPGKCTADAECVVGELPAQFTCAQCAGVCLVCWGQRFCF